MSSLERENDALKAELERLNSSLRMRAATLIAEAASSPSAMFEAFPKALQLWAEIVTTRAWRRLIVALECGVPDDPLRSLESSAGDGSRVRKLERRARRGLRGDGDAASERDPVVRRAAARMDELADIAGGDDVLPASVLATAGTDTNAVVMALHAGQLDTVNGYTRRSHELLKALSAGGWDIVGGVRQNNAGKVDAEIDGVRYLRLPAFSVRQDSLRAYYDAYAGALAELVERQRPALVHGVSNHVTGVAAARAARGAGLPFIYEVRGLWEVTRVSVEPRYEGSLGYRAQRRVEVDLAKHADQLIVNGEPLAAFFAQQGVEPSRIHVAPNGCTPEAYDGGRARAGELRARWGLGDGPVIGFVGSLTAYEGLTSVFEACARLRDQPFQLLLVGDGPARAELETLAARLGLTGRTRFVGWASPPDARAAYALIDIAPIVRSDTPVARLTPPLKPLEAMAGQSAVVVSNVAGLAEFASEGQAEVVPCGDVAALTAVFERLLSDTGARASLASAGREWVERRRRWDVIAQTVEAAYRAVL